MSDIRLVVVDAAPLITLATADSLDLLLYPKLPLIVPDAVFHEATASAGKLGAVEIIDWYRLRSDQVRVEPTDAFRDAVELSTSRGTRLSRDLGERAALEVVRHTALLRDEGDLALLLSDDRDVQRLLITDPARIVLMTTWDFLHELEAAQRIQSSEATLERARAKGREAPKRTIFADHDPAIVAAVRSVLER